MALVMSFPTVFLIEKSVTYNNLFYLRYDCQLITRAGIRRLRNHLPNIKVHAYFAPVTPPASVGATRHRYCRCCVILWRRRRRGRRDQDSDTKDTKTLSFYGTRADIIDGFMYWKPSNKKREKAKHRTLGLSKKAYHLKQVILRALKLPELAEGWGGQGSAEYWTISFLFFEDFPKKDYLKLVSKSRLCGQCTI